MKRFLKWTAIIGGGTVATVVVVRGIQRGRQKMKAALGQAEAVARSTRSALQETETALRQTREAI